MEVENHLFVEERAIFIHCPFSVSATLESPLLGEAAKGEYPRKG